MSASYILSLSTFQQIFQMKTLLSSIDLTDPAALERIDQLQEQLHSIQREILHRKAMAVHSKLQQQQSPGKPPASPSHKHDKVSPIVSPKQQSNTDSGEQQSVWFKHIYSSQDMIKDRAE